MATLRQPQQGKTLAAPRRGEIYLVNFDPTVGSEIQKTRPALVIQNDISNRYGSVTIVAAITSKFKEPPHPTEVIMDTGSSGLVQKSSVLLNQIRTVDRQRLVKRLGRADSETMKRVDRAILISLGLVEI
ncbi:MAG: type II toxin-antitoxin system PemK/MazF family toxin [Bryobacterales bacterium]|nr:type II toxin-antitoxin system PemK/MazF family toxin [Bryobacterales bacterium]